MLTSQKSPATAGLFSWLDNLSTLAVVYLSTQVDKMIEPGGPGQGCAPGQGHTSMIGSTSMHDEVTPSSTDGQVTTERRTPAWRDSLRNVALENALRKCSAGVPTLSVPEAAALLSVSQEHLYRLIQAESFPAVRIGLGGRQGRYVVPTVAVHALLNSAVSTGSVTDAAQWTKQWQAASVVDGEVA